MIVLDLRCDHNHRFEGWFGSADAFAEQCARGLVSCPECGSTAIDRLPSAPYVQTRQPQPPAAQPDKPRSAVPERASAGAPPSAARPFAAPPAAEAAIAFAVAALRRMSRDAEDVGERFPDEARRIHYGEIEARSIRGQASRDELGELLEEGITVLPVPPDEDLH
ncbi:MAG: DUF1178 family protein [Thauera phenolivorans]|uniref:DUF1178 family protein n=1 Tax=Thauera phenolivorans TaxID=1792543 RepID=A0A7X7R808_9RHOO|nr:DUF1178 family protein [Thauera phenolivorans]NLF54282.1 DUF1178 family protein [Thauera phenolivorans]